MNCQKFQDQFDERLDNRLEEARIVKFNEHVAACPDCRKQWQAYQALWDLVAQQPALEPTFGFAQRTLRQLHETAKAARVAFWQMPVFRWVTIGSMLVVVGISGLMTWHQHDVRHNAEIYAAAHQDTIEDLDVIATLDKLQGDPAPLKRVLAVLILAVTGLAGGAVADSLSETNAPHHRLPLTDEQKVERADEAWSKLTPDAKMRLIRIHQALMEMPIEERQLIHQQIERFLTMTLAEREQLKKNAQTWSNMTPEQRERARELYRQRHQQDLKNSQTNSVPVPATP